MGAFRLLHLYLIGNTFRPLLFLEEYFEEAGMPVCLLQKLGTMEARAAACCYHAFCHEFVHQRDAKELLGNGSRNIILQVAEVSEYDNVDIEARNSSFMQTINFCVQRSMIELQHVSVSWLFRSTAGRMQPLWNSADTSGWPERPK